MPASRIKRDDGAAIHCLARTQLMQHEVTKLCPPKQSSKTPGNAPTKSRRSRSSPSRSKAEPPLKPPANLEQMVRKELTKDDTLSWDQTLIPKQLRGDKKRR